MQYYGVNTKTKSTGIHVYVTHGPKNASKTGHLLII